MEKHRELASTADGLDNALKKQKLTRHVSNIFHIETDKFLKVANVEPAMFPDEEVT